MPPMVLSFFRVLGWGGGVKEIGLPQECEPSEWPADETYGEQNAVGETPEMKMCPDTECNTHSNACHSLGGEVVRETLVLPEDGRTMFSPADCEHRCCLHCSSTSQMSGRTELLPLVQTCVGTKTKHSSICNITCLNILHCRSFSQRE